MADSFVPDKPDSFAPDTPKRDAHDVAKQEVSTGFPGATGFELLPHETARRDPMREIKQRLVLTGAEATGVPGLRRIAEFVTPGTVPEVATMGIMGLPGRGLGALAGKILGSAATGVKGGLSEQGETVKTGLMGLLGAGASKLWDPAFRAGSYAYKRFGTEIADKIVKEAGKLTAWWKDLPAGHEGVQTLVREGVGKLQQGYGAAVKKAFGDSLQGQKIPLAAEDAAALNLAPASKAFPEGTVLVDAAQAVDAAALRGHSTMGGAIEERVRAAVGQLVEALTPSRPEAAARIGEALSGKAPTAARAQYREGMNFLDALMKANVLDPASKLVDARQFIMGLDRAFSAGGVPQTIWRRFLGPSRAPEARAAMQRIVPRGTRAPEEVPLPFFGERTRGFRISERSPFEVGYKHVPQSEAEAQFSEFVPQAVTALSRGIGDFGHTAESVSP